MTDITTSTALITVACPAVNPTPFVFAAAPEAPGSAAAKDVPGAPTGTNTADDAPALADAEEFPADSVGSAGDSVGGALVVNGGAKPETDLEPVGAGPSAVIVTFNF
ncbi:hypothetical protein C8R44DRAFT_869092 [Mycena epipterygia]|nr:hypothetical protein C8R44DRAFT_869092 [Mycena epipterygia]